MEIEEAWENRFNFKVIDKRFYRCWNVHFRIIRVCKLIKTLIFCNWREGYQSKSISIPISRPLPSPLVPQSSSAHLRKLRAESEVYKALPENRPSFSSSLTKRNENRAWSQVRSTVIKSAIDTIEVYQLYITLLPTICLLLFQSLWLCPAIFVSSL